MQNKDKDLGPLLKEHCQEKERLQKKLEVINAQISQIEAFIGASRGRVHKIGGPLRKIEAWHTPQSAMLKKKSKTKILKIVGQEKFQLLRNDDETAQNTPPKITFTPINWDTNKLPLEMKHDFVLPQLSNPSVADSNRKINHKLLQQKANNINIGRFNLPVGSNTKKIKSQIREKKSPKVATYKIKKLKSMTRRDRSTTNSSVNRSFVLNTTSINELKRQEEGRGQSVNVRGHRRKRRSKTLSKYSQVQGMGIKLKMPSQFSSRSIQVGEVGKKESK